MKEGDKMSLKNKLYYSLLAIIIMTYFIGLYQTNDLIGDILSPIITLIFFIIIFNGFVLKEKLIPYRITGVLTSLAVFNWFLCDFFWGYYSLILKVDPESNLFVLYGYSLTNVFLLFSFLVFFYLQIKQWNKMQFFVDSIVIFIGVAIFIWLIIFDNDINKANILKDDLISAASLAIDLLLYTWLSIWYLQIRKMVLPDFLNHLGIGILVFIVADVIYYYQYFYTEYVPNSIVDGMYVIAFLFIALSAIRRKEFTKKNLRIANYVYEGEATKIKKELLLLIIPITLLVFKREHTEYIIVVVIVLMLYYLFTSYIQKHIFIEQMARKDREYIEELEVQVEQRTREIIDLTNLDIITGLHSKRYFESYLEEISKEVRRGEKLILLFADQNKYKIVRDMYGVVIAEQVLKELGKRLESIIEDKEGKVASFGEDTFCVLIKGYYEVKEIEKIAADMIHKCSGVYRIDENDIVVTLNIGLSIYPNNVLEPLDLIKNAQIAMKEARDNGFNKYYIFNKELGEKIDKHNRLEVMLKKVNYDEEFFLNFQPQINTFTKEIVGVEALCRWVNKQEEFIPPLEFIPIAEETGLIIQLGYWVLENALKHLEYWNKLSKKDIRIGVNISVKQLNDKNFIDRVYNFLKQYNIKPEKLELEITENVQLEENAEIVKAIETLVQMGITIAIDDFGTGYSSLSYIKKLPIKRIKIAKEIVDNIETDLYDKTIIKAVVDIAKQKEVVVIAEGVEKEQQLNILKQLNCNEIQGYYFSKPLSSEDLINNWLK